MTEKTLSSEYIYKGKIMNVRRDEVECQDGRKSIREVCEHCDAVAVLPVTEDKKVVLVSQFRYPFLKVICEAPAGKMEDGEDPLECARREMSEETGYDAEDMTYFGFIYPSPGCFTERVHLYLAENLKNGDAHPDEGEFLEVSHVDLKDAVGMIDDGEISDAKTVVLIMRAAKKYGLL